jgi:hypothetical protein
MPERIDGGRALAAIGALALIVSLFLNWFTISGVGFHGPNAELTGWESFEVLDMLLTFLALVVIVHAVPALGRAVHAPDEPSALFPAIGVVAFVIVVVSLINHPPAAAGYSIAFGAWLGFAGAALMAIGGILSAARVSIVVAVAPRDRSAAPPPEAYPTEPGTHPTDPFDAGSEPSTRRLRRRSRQE